MLILQFILQNGHFALSLFAALVFFAVSWLYLDAYLVAKSKNDLFKIIGFCLLSLSFLINSTFIEQTILTNSIISLNLIGLATDVIKLFGFVFLIFGLLTDRIQKKPVYNEKTAAFGFISITNPLSFLWYLLFPFFSFFVFILYLRRTIVGLEKHLRPLTIGFLFIFLYELFSLSRLFEATNSVYVYKIIQPFGPIWLISHLFLLISTLIIAKWIFSYLLKRIQTQFFMIFNISILIIFLITTVSFTGLLLNSFRDDAFSHLTTDVNVVKYAIGLKQEETLSDAELVSQNPQIQKAILNKDRNALKELSTSLLIAKKESYLILVASTGAVLMRGEDNEKTGDSLSNDALFIRAIRGEKASSVVAKDGSIAPIVSIRSAVPINSGQSIIGAVIVGTDIDNAFVDGLKKSTKLDVSVYGGNSLSATTFVAEDGKSRFVGIKEENKGINKNVLIEGKDYSLDINILNESYFASFASLKDIDGNPVGMLFVGKKQASVIQAASRSIEYTFIIAAFLILISIFPSYLISKFIAKQFK